MTINEIILLYAIIHLFSVVYMFKMFDSQNYVADDLDMIIVWLFAPFLVTITLIKVIGGKNDR